MATDCLTAAASRITETPVLSGISLARPSKERPWKLRSAAHPIKSWAISGAFPALTVQPHAEVSLAFGLCGKGTTWVLIGMTHGFRKHFFFQPRRYENK